MKQIFSQFIDTTTNTIISEGVNQKTNHFHFQHGNTVQKKEKNALSIIKSYFFSLPMNPKISSSITNEQKSNKHTTTINIHQRIFFSTPTFSHTTTKVNIHVFYYIASKKNFTAKNTTKHLNLDKTFSITMVNLSKSLSLLFNKEVSLSVTKIYYPYLNANIFAQYLAHNSSSNTFSHFQDAILSYPSLYSPNDPINAYNSGIKIQVAGRLTTQRSIPRVTTKTAIYGSFSHGPVIDYGKCSLKNYIGAFTIKVWLAQRTK